MTSIIKHQTKHSAGADLECSETITIKPNETVLVKTNYYLDKVREGVVYILFARSSICLKKGLILANSVGVIDSDYPNEVMCMYHNLGNTDVTLEKGERIAQIVPMHYITDIYETVDKEREGGFGSSNK